MTRCQIIFLFFFLLQSLSYAGHVEVRGHVPWSYLKAQVPRSFQYSYQENFLKLSSPSISPELKNMNVDFAGELQGMEFSQEGIFASAEIGIEAHIQKTVIDQVITREVAGNIINVHLKADCGPIKLSIIDSSIQSIFQFVQVGPDWFPELKGIELKIPSENIRINPFTCQGVGGIGEEIKSEILTLLNDPREMLKILRPYLADQISQFILHNWALLNTSLSPTLEDGRILRPTDKGIDFSGKIMIQAQREIILSEVDENLITPDYPKLILSEKGFEALLEDQFLQKIPTDYNLQEVAAFHDLMQSRFKQYFAWPDLRRFPKNNPFLLSFNLNETQLKLQETSSGMVANLKSNGFIRTPIGGSYIDYIQFGMGISTPMNVIVKDSVLSIKNGGVDLSLAWNYGLLYQLLYKPSNRIALDILKSGLQGVFKNQNVTGPLPVLKIGERSYYLNDWKKHNETITMDWK